MKMCSRSKNIIRQGQLLALLLLDAGLALIMGTQHMRRYALAATRPGSPIDEWRC